MKNRVLGTLMTIVAILSIQGLPGRADGLQRAVTIAILPCNNIEITFRKFYPLLTYVQKETGLNVRLVVPSSLEEFEGSLKSGQIDFALQDPHTYAQLSQRFNRSELLRSLTLEGRTAQSGVVIVRRDSGIGGLQDLRGRTVMFGPKTSTPKWMAAKLLFVSNGIDLDKDLKAYRNGGCCEDIAFSVYMNSVDAGVICEHFLTEHDEKQKDLGVDAGKLRVIARTAQFPTRVFAARLGTPPEVVKQVNRALLKLDPNRPEDAKIMLRGEIGGFRPGSDADYAALRRSTGTPSSK